jgi:hypothetical protein
MEAAYAANVNLIRAVAWKFTKRYGTDFDETFAEANMGFMVSAQTYEPGKGDFAQWLGYGIWHRLQNWLKAATRANRKPEPGASFYTTNFNLGIFLADLSQEGREVAELALDAPEEVLQAAHKAGGHPRNLSSALKQHLREQGWTGNQIWRAWREVREALG